MKNARYVALNWALVALTGVSVIYAMVSIFGTMPAMTIGGYQIPIGQKENKEIVFATMPAIGRQFWFVIVPLVAFAIRYFVGLVKTDKKETVEGTIFGTIVGTILGMIVGMISGMIVGMISGTIGGTIGGTILGMIVGMISGTIGGTIGGTIFGTIQWLIYGLFLTPYKMEFLMVLPGIFAVLLLINMSLVSILPMGIAFCERIFSKRFWQGLVKVMTMEGSVED